MSEEQSEVNAIEVVTREITALSIVEGYTIASQEEALGANEALGKVKTLAKMIDAARDGERRPLNEQLKAIQAKYKPAADLLEQAEQTLKASLLAFQKAETRRIELENQERERAAAAERAKLEEEARKERERAELKAEKLRQAGKVEQADAVVQVAESTARAKETVAQLVATPVKPIEPVKLAGASIRKKWRGKVTDLRQFIKSLANSAYPVEEFVEVKQASLDRLAGSLQGNMDRAMPGSIAWPEETMGARAR